MGRPGWKVQGAPVSLPLAAVRVLARGAHKADCVAVAVLAHHGSERALRRRHAGQQRAIQQPHLRVLQPGTVKL
jgi:hypothetical protein